MLQRMRAFSLIFVSLLVIILGMSSPAQAVSIKAPTKVTTVSTTNSVTIKWAKVKGATHYTVCAKKVETDKKCYKTSPKLTKTSWKISNVGPTKGVDYSFTVTAHSKSNQKSAKVVKAALKPAVTKNVKVETTESSVLVTWSEAKNATAYEVCFRTAGKHTKCWKNSGETKGTSYKLDGLKPTDGTDYFVTVTSIRGKEKSPSGSVAADLKVGKIKTPKATVKNFETVTISWEKPLNANKFEVELADNEKMERPIKKVTTSSTTLDVGSLDPKSTYFARVTPLNSSTPGAPSPTIAVTTDSPKDLSVSVMSYNLCGKDQCIAQPYPHFPTWSTRAPLIQTWLADLSPDIMAFQEDPGKIAVPGYTRTEYKSAKSLLFKTSKFTKVRGGSITMPRGDSSMKDKYAVWAELRDTETGVNFIVVDPHLQHGKGVKYDNARKIQTEKLLADIQTINKSGLPLVIAGDMNSNASNANQKKYPGGYDAPDQIFSANGYVNTLKTAGKVANANFNTANQGSSSTIPKVFKNSHHVDAIWATPDIKVTAWVQSVRMNGLLYELPFYSDHNPITATILIPHPLNRSK